MEETNGEAEGTTIAEDHNSSEGDMERKHSEILLKQNKWRTNVGQIGAGLTGRTLQDSSQTM